MKQNNKSPKLFDEKLKSKSSKIPSIQKNKQNNILSQELLQNKVTEIPSKRKPKSNQVTEIPSKRKPKSNQESNLSLIRPKEVIQGKITEIPLKGKPKENKESKVGNIRPKEIIQSRITEIPSKENKEFNLELIKLKSVPIFENNITEKPETFKIKKIEAKPKRKIYKTHSDPMKFITTNTENVSSEPMTKKSTSKIEKKLEIPVTINNPQINESKKSIASDFMNSAPLKKPNTRSESDNAKKFSNSNLPKDKYLPKKVMDNNLTTKEIINSDIILVEERSKTSDLQQKNLGKNILMEELIINNSKKSKIRSLSSKKTVKKQQDTN